MVDAVPVTEPDEITLSEIQRPRSVAILVDDLATWLASGMRPTGIQRVVSELIETAFARPDLRPWPAVFIGGTEPGDRLELVAIARDGLGWEPRGAKSHLPLALLRGARAIVAPLPMPRSWWEAAKLTYGRALLRLAGIRPEARANRNETDLLLVPGGFWMHAETAMQIRLLAQTGLPVRLILYDLFPVTNPEWVTQLNREAFTHALDLLLPLCDRIVVLSHLVAESLVARYPSRAGLIRIAPPTLAGSGRRIGLASHEESGALIPGPFILALSTVEPRKNHRAIIDAWRLAREDGRLADAYLAVVGRRGWMADDIEAGIARDGERLHIRRIDKASDGQVEALYGSCLATVHASWAEGFGLPVRESVARGIPTLMSSGIPDDGLPAGSYQIFDPADVTTLARMMVATVVGGRVRHPVVIGNGTGWEPVLSALID